MSTTRRNFLLAVAGSTSGLILPSFYERALAYLANHGEPLLVPPRDPKLTLTVYPDWDNLISLGDPLADPPVFTWRQMFQYLEPNGDLSGFMSDHGLEQDDLDEEANEEYYLDRWYSTDSGYAKASSMLERLGIGSLDDNGQVVGGIEYISDPESMGGYSTSKALALDMSSVALLQHELNDRGAGVAINVAMG